MWGRVSPSLCFKARKPFIWKQFFYSHANRTHFHNKGFTLGVVLKAESEFFWLENDLLSKGQSSNPIFFSSADPDYTFKTNIAINRCCRYYPHQQHYQKPFKPKHWPTSIFPSQDPYIIKRAENVIRIKTRKMNHQREMLWSFIKFSQLIL